MEMVVQLQQQMTTILQQQQGPRITVANYQEGEDIQDFLTTLNELWLDMIKPTRVG